MMTQGNSVGKTLPWPLRVPVVAAPMFLISGPELVLAACKAGIIGAFPTPNARPIEVLEQWMTQITEGLRRAADEEDTPVAPWCANLVTHSSNTRLAEDLKLIERFKPPVVVTALGSPKPAMAVVQGYGGKVIADVTTIPLAKKAAAAGVDGLACISAGAGGHTGALSPFAFVAAVREFFDGMLIIGGGISDGHGVAGAVACGADLVYMGTRFIATAESRAEAGYKDMLVNATVDDLVISSALTGAPVSWLKPSLVANGLDPDNMPAAPARSYDSNQSLESKRWRDVWAAGQGVGAIKAVQPVAAVVDELTAQYRDSARRLAARSA